MMIWIKNLPVVSNNLSSYSKSKENSNIALSDDISIVSDGKGKYGKHIRKENSKFIICKTINGVKTRFGVFDTQEEAIKHRDELIANNWGLSDNEKVDIKPEGKYGRYISFQHDVYKITKSIDGVIHIFGFYSSLENAKKAKDILIDNNWDISLVPKELFKDDLGRHNYIRNVGGKYIVSKVIDGKLQYFGTYDNKEEAIFQRNILMANNWKVDNVVEEEKYDMNVYVKDDIYIVKKEGNEDSEVFGTFNDSIEAINFRNLCIRNNWFVEKQINIPLTDDSCDYLDFSFTVGKSYKSRGWVIPRIMVKEQFPDFPCEGNLKVVIDNKEFTGYWNCLFRLFYKSTEEAFTNYLKDVSIIDKLTKINGKLLLDEGPLDFNNDGFNYSIDILKEYSPKFIKRKGFVVSREIISGLFPLLPYEEHCKFVIDDFIVNGRLNILFRIKLDNSVLNYLKQTRNECDKFNIKLLFSIP